MNYIILDLEWNQAPVPQLENRDIPFEIIEIGAVRLDEDMQTTGEFSRLIKPVVYKRLHNHTKKLIHLSMSDLYVNGEPFKTVCKDFLKFCGSDPIFCTWGPQDLSELQRNMDYYGMKSISSGPLPYLDVQKLYALHTGTGKKRASLQHAIEELGLDMDSPFHRALGDAEYTARVLAALPRQLEEYKSYDLYHKPTNRENELHLTFPGYTKYISRKFASKTAVMRDREVKSTVCISCGKRIPKTGPTFSTNGKHYLNISLCPEHGLMKTKLRIFKDASDGMYYVVKTNRHISREELEAITSATDKSVHTKRG